jgi:hypothetical protein
LRSTAAQGAVTPLGMASFAAAELPTSTVTTTTMTSALTQMVRPTSYVAVSSLHSTRLPSLATTGADPVAAAAQTQNHSVEIVAAKEKQPPTQATEHLTSMCTLAHPPISDALAPVSASIKPNFPATPSPKRFGKKEAPPPMLAPLEACLTEQEALECTQGLADVCRIGMLDALELDGVNILAIVMLKEDLLKDIISHPNAPLPTLWAKALDARINNQHERTKYIRLFLAVCAKRSTFTGGQEASHWTSCGAKQLQYSRDALPEFASCLTAYNTGDVMLLRAELTNSLSVLRTSKLAVLMLLGGELGIPPTIQGSTGHVTEADLRSTQAPPRLLATLGTVNSIWRQSPEKSAKHPAANDKLFSAVPVRRYGGTQMVAWMSDEKGSYEN